MDGREEHVDGCLDSWSRKKEAAGSVHGSVGGRSDAEGRITAEPSCHQGPGGGGGRTEHSRNNGPFERFCRLPGNVGTLLLGAGGGERWWQRGNNAQFGER